MDNSISTQATSNPANTTDTQLETMSVKDFMKSNGLTVVNTVRENTNGYPYLTFINKDNVAENIYFSKSLSDKFSAGQPVIKGFFTGIIMSFVTYEDGREDRWKLSSEGGNRLDADSLFD